VVNRKVIITTPYPTPEWIAEYYKIPPKRVAELKEIIAEARRSIERADARKKKKTINGQVSSNNSAARKAKKPEGR
jgi:hypothetical protein